MKVSINDKQVKIDKVALERMNVPYDHWEVDPNRLNPTIAPIIHKYVSQLVVPGKRLPGPMLELGCGLIFGGPPATGKTSAAVYCAEQIRSWGVTTYFTTLWALKEGLARRDTVFVSDQSLLDHVRTVNCLVIDDVDTIAQNYSFTRESFTSLIRERNENRRITLMTTPLSRPEFVHAFPGLAKGLDFRNLYYPVDGKPMTFSTRDLLTGA